MYGQRTAYAQQQMHQSYGGAPAYGQQQQPQMYGGAQAYGQQQQQQPPPYGGAPAYGQQPQQSQSGGPLANKVMVLYIKPGDPVSMQAWQMVVDYPEVLVQDATQIHPRPPWLDGVPTVVRVSDKMVFAGPQAFQVIAMYINNIKSMAGAQSQMVVPTMDPMKAFAVADKKYHGMAAIEERTVDVPLGQTTTHGMSVGKVNFATDDDPRYYQTGKVSEQDVNQYNAMREQKRQRPVQWTPSLLEDGTMVSM